MKIIRATENLTLKEKYDLTRNPTTENMSNHIGEIIAVKKFMIREEERGDTGEVSTIVSIFDGEKSYATNSMVFCREFDAITMMAEESGENVNHIQIVQGMSKKGRPFVTCAYID